MIQQIPCRLKGNTVQMLSQAQVRLLLGYQASAFPKELDLLDVKPETLNFAYDVNVNMSFHDTKRYHQHTADTYLRYRRFMEKHYQSDDQPNTRGLIPFGTMPDMQAHPESDELKKISIDRLQLSKEEFQQEMQELINFFPKAERFQVGQPPGFNILLSREEFQALIRRGSSSR